MKRSGELKRSSKRPDNRGPRRFWDDASDKLLNEGVCRYCRRVPSGDFGDRLEIAHVSGRKYDKRRFGIGDHLYVDPVDIVPLCTQDHLAFDAHKIDILPFLTWPEQAAVVKNRGMVGAWKHLTGGESL